MKVRAFYPVPLVIDGEEIVLRIKRMTMEEHSDFSSRFAKVGTPTIVRFVSRASSGAEQEQDQKGEYVIPLEKIAEKRLAEMSPEKRAEYDAAVEADEVQAKEFLVDVFKRFVTVERGLIEELADGERSVTSGVDFLRIFGARSDILQRTLEAVRHENELDAHQKKIWRSRAASSRSSTGRPRARAGRKRGTTAEPAVTVDSADNGDAITPRKDPSGSTETSPSNPVRSLH